MKQDADGSALPGAVFLPEFSVDNGGTWRPVTAREAGDNVTAGRCTSPGLTEGQLTTGPDGTVTFTGLRADGNTLYRLTETAAPEGMALLGEPLYVGALPVEVTGASAADSETVDGKTYCYTLYITATDTAVFRLPETGGNGGHLPLALLPAVLLKAKRKF